MLRCMRLLLVIASLAFLSAAAVAAERYPTRPVRLVVPFPPGGITDTLARLIGQKLGERLGQTFVVDNRPGAASMIGTITAAKAQADGYTLLVTDIPFVLNVAIHPNPRYDAIKDFSPITQLGTAPAVLAAHLSFKANSIKELIAMPRAQTERFALGTSGVGSGSHVAYELLRLKTGLVLNHVPYKGGGPMIADLAAGQIPLGFVNIVSVLPYATGASPSIKGLALTSATRHPLMPAVATFAESGVKELIIKNWAGVFAPNGTPSAVVKLLNHEIGRVLELPDIKDRFASVAVDIAPLGPEEFRKFIEIEVRRWKDVVAKAGIKLSD